MLQANEWEKSSTIRIICKIIDTKYADTQGGHAKRSQPAQGKLTGSPHLFKAHAATANENLDNFADTASPTEFLKLLFVERIAQ